MINEELVNNLKAIYITGGIKHEWEYEQRVEELIPQKIAIRINRYAFRPAEIKRIFGCKIRVNTLKLRSIIRRCKQ